MFKILQQSKAVTFIYQTEEQTRCIKYENGSLVSIVSVHPDSSSFQDYVVSKDNYYVLDGVCPNLVGVNCKVIEVTSPKRERWHTFSKHPITTMYVMKGWEFSELDHARELLKLEMTKIQLKSRYAILGGTFRWVLTGVSVLPNPQTLVDRSLEALDLEKCVDSNGELGTPSKMSNILVHLLPPESRTYSDTTYDFASNYVRNLVVEKLKKSHLNFFNDIINFSQSNVYFSSLKGRIFEDYAHSVLVKGGDFYARLLPMNERKTKPIKSPSKVHFDASDLTDIDQLDDIKTAVALPLHNYLKPISRNFPSIDSLLPPNHLFQMVTGLGQHGFKVQGLVNVIKCLNKKDIAKEIIIYLVLPEAMLNSYKVQSYEKVDELSILDKAFWNSVVSRIKQYALGIPPFIQKKIESESESKSKSESEEPPPKKIKLTKKK